uniref:Uncharacterized protein AlNc14C236G9392 n=1 Tax=Albugo laibachii Nc14 TaxID=890382 RepID=F0W8C9_9STRA|nr:conserved hypothetical protein [Albugo laibachii Nc14]CCA24374.1 conserved hypothetical protein [Albugo laibachii Nc14]|eukprot:CCA24374.1 conserved hypothetical protein [Albugo laibachii Nc14]
MSSPLPRPAGKCWQNDGESTAACFHPQARPGTPEHVRRYRKSYFAEPGARIIHPGLLKDVRADADVTFGVVSDKSQHLRDVMRTGPSTDFEWLQQQQREGVYASHCREPLGTSYSRGHVLPKCMQSPEFAHGTIGSTSESAKELLYPRAPPSPDSEALYRKSHHASLPGEQKKREYDWGDIKPSSYRFGRVNIHGEDISACFQDSPHSILRPKQVEGMRGFHDRLGKPRYLSAASRELDVTHVYGTRVKSDEGSARECIQSCYSHEEQGPDVDLGKPRHYGWKNTTCSLRKFGIPTIRADIPAPNHRSIADCQNYGDESATKEILYPSKFAMNGISEEEFTRPREEAYLRDLFEKIGFGEGEETASLIWSALCVKGEGVSIAEYRDALNEYYNAKSKGLRGLEQWRKRVEAASASNVNF